MNDRLLLFIALGLVLAWGQGCEAPSSPKTPLDNETRDKEILRPSFDPDSAFAFVAKQVDFGPRVPNTFQHDQCGQWLAEELTRHGAEVTVQEGRARAYDGSILNMQNIVGAFHPESRDRILLFAHWDTRPFADKDSTRTRCLLYTSPSPRD